MRGQVYSLVIVILISISMGAGITMIIAPKQQVITPSSVVTITEQAKPAPAVTITKKAKPVPTVTVTAPAVAAEPPVPHVNGATHLVYVDCSQEQCTALPGAGPNGSTCGAIVNDRQACVY